MNITKDYLITHKFYDYKMRRISVFGRMNPQLDTLSLYIITCSKKDKFSRKEARKLLEDYFSPIEEDEIHIGHPQIFRMASTAITYKKDFIDFCYSNFFVRETVATGVIGFNKQVLADFYINNVTKEIKIDQSSMRVNNMSQKMVDQYVHLDIESEEDFNNFKNNN